MKRAVKFVVSAIFLICFAPAALIARYTGRHHRQHLTILYYHAVPKAAASQFRRQMALLSKVARVVATDWQGDAAPGAGRPAVAISFDDALDSVFDVALPILAEFGFPCTIFVPAGCIGTVPSWPTEGAPHDEAVATAGRLQACGGPLVHLGSHTMTHPALSTLAPDQIEHEVTSSRAALEALTGQVVRQLAFPYGDYDGRTPAACRRAGYTHVFSIEPRVVDVTRHDFVRGRVAAQPDDSRAEFFLKAMGAYRWMVAASALKRRAARHAG